MKQPGMNSFSVDDKSLYSVNTLNNTSIISWHDKSSANVKTISKKDVYIGRLDLYDDTLYAFAMTKEKEGIKSNLYLIDTKSFEITATLDISTSGTGQYFSIKIGDAVYFTNQNEISGMTERRSYNLSRLSIKDKTILNTRLKEEHPFQIVNYKDKLIISHYDPVQIQGKKITLYDLKTNEQQVVTLENNLSQILIKDDKVYSTDGEYLYAYSINNTAFKLINKIDIYTKRNSSTFYYVSGFFTK